MESIPLGQALVYNQGDIILVPFPFTDLSGSKPRPAIIISNSEVHQSNDVIIAQLTTQTIYGKFSFEISNADVTTPFKPPHDTQYIYCKKIAVVEKSIIIKKITTVKEIKTLKSILEIVKSIFTLDNRS